MVGFFAWGKNLHPLKCNINEHNIAIVEAGDTPSQPSTVWYLCSISCVKTKPPPQTRWVGRIHENSHRVEAPFHNDSRGVAPPWKSNEVIVIISWDWFEVEFWYRLRSLLSWDWVFKVKLVFVEDLFCWTRSLQTNRIKILPILPWKSWHGWLEDIFIQGSVSNSLPEGNEITLTPLKFNIDAQKWMHSLFHSSN